MSQSITWCLLFLLTPLLVSGEYVLKKDYFQPAFFEGPDPTNGFVQYSGRDETLISSTSNSAQMRVSTKQSTPSGRPSIRIKVRSHTRPALSFSISE